MNGRCSVSTRFVKPTSGGNRASAEREIIHVPVHKPFERSTVAEDVARAIRFGGDGIVKIVRELVPVTEPVMVWVRRNDRRTAGDYGFGKGVGGGEKIQDWLPATCV